MKKLSEKFGSTLEHIANNAASWIGSVSSIVVHTILFVFAFTLYFFGIGAQKILLVVTTLVSLEAIYLAIFIQMSVNQQGTNLKEVAHDIDEIQEDVEEIQEDVEEIEKDIEEEMEHSDEQKLEKIQITLTKLMEDIEELRKK